MYVIYLGFLDLILYRLWCIFYVDMLLFLLYEDIIFGGNSIPL